MHRTRSVWAYFCWGPSQQKASGFLWVVHKWGQGMSSSSCPFLIWRLLLWQEAIYSRNKYLTVLAAFSPWTVIPSRNKRAVFFLIFTYHLEVGVMLLLMHILQSRMAGLGKKIERVVAFCRIAPVMASFLMLNWNQQGFMARGVTFCRQF